MKITPIFQTMMNIKRKTIWLLSKKKKNKPKTKRIGHDSLKRSLLCKMLKE